MRIEDIKVGDSIKNKKPYDGEGEYIVCDLSPPLFEGCIKVISALCIKYPELNGLVSYIDNDNLKFYHKVKN